MSRVTPTPTSTLRQRKQRATRDRLQVVAQELFVERGYHGTTMEDIAAGAQVSRATAFNYFPRKEEFLVAWVARRRSVMADLLTQEEADSVNALDRLRHAMRSLCDTLEADPQASRALTRAWVHAGGPLLPNAFETAAVLAETISHGQRRGDLRRNLDPDIAGRTLLDAYLGVLVRWSAENDEQAGSGNLRHQVASALDLVIDGLRP